MARVIQSWRKLTSNGVPNLIVIRRPLPYDSSVIQVGEAVNEIVPGARLRPLYEARRIGPAAPVIADVTTTKGKHHGTSKK